MATTIDSMQAISRLTPLTEVLAMADLGIKPVAPRTIDVALAAGRTLASDATVHARPNAAIALTDGWAMNAEETLGAGSYAPASLMRPPQRVEAGQAMPPDTDGVAPFDAVRLDRDRAEALSPVNSGEGVLPAGGDCDPAIPLRRAGERLRLTDLAAFAAAGLARISVREPRIHILPVRGNAIVNAAARLVAGDIERNGGAPRIETGRDLKLAFAEDSADGFVVIGGTGSGRNDTSVQTLMREGKLGVHGIAVTPARQRRSDFPVRARCCCCRGGSTPCSRCGSRSAGGCWRVLPAATTASRRRTSSLHARFPRRSALLSSYRCCAAATPPSHWPRNICRSRRWRAPTAGFLCRPTAKAIRKARQWR